MNCIESPQKRVAGPSEIIAPWSDQQVAGLNEYQRSGYFHPYTSTGGVALIATRDGWIEREGGPVVQKWALAASADPELQRAYTQMTRVLSHSDFTSPILKKRMED